MVDPDDGIVSAVVKLREFIGSRSPGIVAVSEAEPDVLTGVFTSYILFMESTDKKEFVSIWGKDGHAFFGIAVDGFA